MQKVEQAKRKEEAERREEQRRIVRQQQQAKGIEEARLQVFDAFLPFRAKN